MLAKARVKPDTNGGWKVEIEKYYGTLFVHGPYRWYWWARVVAWWLNGNY